MSHSSSCTNRSWRSTSFSWRGPVRMLLLLLLLSGCGLINQSAQPGTAAPSVAAEEAVQSPAPTPLPTPTVASTPTPVAVNPEEVVALVQAAIDRTTAATNYRLTYQVLAQGSPEDPQRERALVDYTVTANAGALHVLDRQESMRAAAGNPNDGLELAVIDRTVYARGPLPFPDARESRWYTLGSIPAAGAEEIMRAVRLIDTLLGQVPLDQLRSDGTLHVDGASCDVYRGGREAALASANGTGVWTKPGPEPSIEEQMADVSLDLAEIQVVICPDGYLHQIETTLAGSVRVADGPRFVSRFRLRVFDFDSATVVAVPENAAPVANPVAALALPLRLTAAVSNGGNVRAEPHTQATVFEQIHAHESVVLLARNDSATWFKIVTPRRVTGWVSGTLLTIDPDVVARLPVE
jgi:hypothetical protein